MPYETLRFLHAARALVDHPLHETGPVGVDLRGLVRGATTSAFRNLVGECLEHDVDFLLLTGDALDQTDFSIKSRVELRDGFERLDDAGIQVFVIPGPRDPLPVWDDFPDMPSNVTVFRPETDDPVAVLRDGAVIASIRAMAWRNSWFGSEDDSPSNSQHSSPPFRGTRAAQTHDDELPYADLSQRRFKEADEAETWDDAIDAHHESLVDENDDPELDEADHHDAQLDAGLPEKHEAHREIRRVQSAADLRPNHFAIAIVRDGIDHSGNDPQADYLAVVGGRERTTSKGDDWLMHFPGGTQGLSPEETGLHGCSLVDLDSDGVIRCRFLPTAPVRWENFQIDIKADTTFEQLVQRMQAACRELCGVPETLPQPQQPQSLVAEYGDAADDDAEDSTDNETNGQRIASHQQLHAQACFLRWTIRGEGALFNSLSAESMQSELADWLDAASDWPLEVARLHRFRLLATEPAAARSTSDDDSDQLDVPTEYFWRIDQAEPLGRSAWSELGQEGAEQQEHFARINAAAPRCDAEVVFSQARRRGWKWFKAEQTK